MKQLSSVFLLFIFLFVSAAGAWGFRCGTHLVSIGDKTFEVQKKCGDPILKETVGYTLTGKRDRRELEIKEWIYGPENGAYHFLTFHGTTLVEIESRRDPN